MSRGEAPALRAQGGGGGGGGGGKKKHKERRTAQAGAPFRANGPRSATARSVRWRCAIAARAENAKARAKQFKRKNQTSNHTTGAKKTS